VLTAWGSLRSWICSGHFTHGLELNELIESLAGLPVDVQFLSFDDLLERGVPRDVKVIINCGRQAAPGAAALLDGAEDQRNPDAVGASGGGFVGWPSRRRCRNRSCSNSRMCSDSIATAASGLPTANTNIPRPPHFITADLAGAPDFGKDVDGIYTLGAGTTVLADKDGSPARDPCFGRGAACTLGFKFTYENTRLLHRALFWRPPGRSSGRLGLLEHPHGMRVLREESEACGHQ